MKMLTFAGRNGKDILRDPINLFFGLGFPTVLLGLLTAIQANIPVAMFQLEELTPGITVFGLSFLSLFSSTLLARDRETAFLQRLYTTPMGAADFIFGYTLPPALMAMGQSLVCYAVAAVMGLEVRLSILWAVLSVVSVSIFYIALGLALGSVLGVKQVGGICGALLTNVSAFLSGIWFDVELVGGFFGKLARCLPFLHAVELERAIYAGDIAGMFPHLWWVLGYTAGAVVLAVCLFFRQMRRN